MHLVHVLTFALCLNISKKSHKSDKKNAMHNIRAEALRKAERVVKRRLSLWTRIGEDR